MLDHFRSKTQKSFCSNTVHLVSNPEVFSITFRLDSNFFREHYTWRFVLHAKIPKHLFPGSDFSISSKVSGSFKHHKRSSNEMVSGLSKGQAYPSTALTRQPVRYTKSTHRFSFELKKGDTGFWSFVSAWKNFFSNWLQRFRSWLDLMSLKTWRSVGLWKKLTVFRHKDSEA